LAVVVQAAAAAELQELAVVQPQVALAEIQVLAAGLQLARIPQ
jgi:hypothetical protein